jgi:glycosyltransferase involved in cell wall biosynthesis
MPYRILCANGPGNTIQHWSEDQHDPRAVTFLNQFKVFCWDIDAEAYTVAYHSDKAICCDGRFTLEHRPKPMPGSTGIRYHLAQALYALSLFFTAVRFRADAAVLDSGTSQYFMLSIFKLAGIKIVVILHNTLWPTGFAPTAGIARVIATLDSLFFRWIPVGIIGVSPECIRQVEQLTSGKHRPIYQIRAQFRREYFQAIPRSRSLNQQPFRILYMGRIIRYKGVFDILDMAKRIEAQRSGQVHWEIHGDGPDSEQLARLQAEMGLRHVVSIYGWTPAESAQEAYARSHVSIVPTRSNFCEGLTMAAIESVLAGRPVITSPVNPALEVLRPACVEARTDDVDSYVQAILGLIDDPNGYGTLCKACPQIQEQFYDPDKGLNAALKTILCPTSSAEVSR